LADEARPASCPFCGGDCPFHIHGSYLRQIYDALCGDPWIGVHRFKSPCHGDMTVSVLPEFATPHKRYSLRVISLALFLHFFLGFSVARVRLGLLEPSFSAIRQWRRDWLFNTPNLLQDGLPAIGVTGVPTGASRSRAEFGGEAFRLCVDHFFPSAASFQVAGWDRFADVSERIVDLGREVLPRFQSSLRRAFPSLWPFRENPA
jgi:hypothetical protein